MSVYDDFLKLKNSFEERCINCDSCNVSDCYECEVFADFVTKGYSNISIGGVFADVARDLFGDELDEYIDNTVFDDSPES